MNAVMPTLPGLVADSEDLARFLASSSWFARTTGRVKSSAFLPAPDNDTSVFRSSGLTPEALWAHGSHYYVDEEGVPKRHHGAAIVSAAVVRKAGIDAIPEEPPPLHANLRGWPIDPDPAIEKAKRKEVAATIAENATLRVLPVA